MKRFILMVQFLTRIPININLKVDENDFLKGIIYFPIVGLIIGMFALSAYYIGSFLSGPFLGAILAVVAEIFMTGGLHLDGLADTFDGIYSNRPKEKILEIMKDSRLGTNGALAIFVVLVTKIALVNEVPTPHIYPILLLMPVLSRLNIVFACRYGKTVRRNGMGNLFIGLVNSTQLLIATSITIILSLIFPPAIPGIILLILFSLWYIRHIGYRIGGITGDVLGSLCELSELVFMFYIAIILKFIN